MPVGPPIDPPVDGGKDPDDENPDDTTLDEAVLIVQDCTTYGPDVHVLPPYAGCGHGPAAPPLTGGSR